MSKRSKQRRMKLHNGADAKPRGEAAAVESAAPDWEGRCEACGASPVVPETGMCGPCTFGEADTANGNW